MKKTFLLTTLILCQIISFGQNSVQEKVQTYRKANEHQLLQEFMGLLSIPNVVYDTVGIQKTAAYIAKMMENNGIKPQFLEGKTKGVPPAIFGEINTPNAITLNQSNSTKRELAKDCAVLLIGDACAMFKLPAVIDKALC